MDDGNEGSLDARVLGRLDHVATLGRCRKKITELLSSTDMRIGVPGSGVDHVAAGAGSTEGSCPFLFVMNFQVHLKPVFIDCAIDLVLMSFAFRPVHRSDKVSVWRMLRLYGRAWLSPRFP